MSSLKVIPGLKHLIPRSHIVKALQFTGDNFEAISNFVPLQFRAYVPNPGGKDVLMVQTVSGCSVVSPSMFILFGRVGSQLGFHVLTEAEVDKSFEVKTGEIASYEPPDLLALVKKTVDEPVAAGSDGTADFDFAGHRPPIQRTGVRVEVQAELPPDPVSLLVPNAGPSVMRVQVEE
jgi:hypothetical protein